MVGGLVDLNAGSCTQTGKRPLRISGFDCLKRRLMNNHLLTEKLVSQGHMNLTSRRATLLLTLMKFSQSAPAY